MKETIHSSKKGQDLVEFALALPIFIFIVMVIVDLGRVAYFYSAVHNAAREGARYGVVSPYNSTGIETAARKLLVGLDSDQITFTQNQEGVDEDGDTKDDYDIIHVTVEYSFIPITPMITTFLGSGSIDLVGKSTMMIE